MRFWGCFSCLLAVAPLSIFIVKRRMAFMAEAMPHSTLAGIVLGNNVMLTLGIGFEFLLADPLGLCGIAGDRMVRQRRLAGDRSFAMMRFWRGCLFLPLPLGCFCCRFCHRP